MHPPICSLPVLGVIVPTSPMVWYQRLPPKSLHGRSYSINPCNGIIKISSVSIGRGYKDASSHISDPLLGVVI